MALSLQAVLGHPVFRRSAARVLAGDPAQGAVRWVHSSDVYDIAPLLRGGELLLTTGLGLADRTPEERRAYVRSLVDRHVTCLALELAGPFTAVPDEMVDEATRTGLCLVALPEVYPFVEVTEQVNSAILESSVVRLQHRDDVGRTLSRVLVARGGLGGLTRSLSELLGCSVVVTGPQGEVLLAAGDDDPQAVLDHPRASAAVTADGLLLGGLVVGAGDTDEELLAAALDRSPEFFALEALRTREGTLLPALERRALLRRLLEGAGGIEVLAGHVPALRTRPGTPWAGLAVGGPPGAALGVVHVLARRAGLYAVTAEVDDAVVALVAGSPGLSRAELGARLADAASASGPCVALGPVVGVDAVGRSLRAARQALRVVPVGEGPRLVDATELVVERLLAGTGQPLLLADLVEEQLGELLRGPGGEASVRTLEVYLASGCSKAATARLLHLRRQSVHQRLSRINTRLGFDVTAPERQTALRLALAARAVLAVRRDPSERVTARPAPE